MYHHRHAKILATIGPSSRNLETLRALLIEGADSFRLNFSHGTHEEHAAVHHHIRSLEKEYNHPIAIVADLQGPKFRLGQFKEKKVNVFQGDTFVLDKDQTLGDSSRCFLPHQEVFDNAEIGSKILIDDGRIDLNVIEKGKDFLKTVVGTTGALSDHKGINIPGIRMPISCLTTKDLHDLEFCLKLDIDWIAISFVQHPKDILNVKEHVKGRAKILTKLEKPMALEFLDEIVLLSDGIIVARGDLGIEMKLEEVPILQKKIITCCKKQAKPVIVATQMLESMVHFPTPTRAEVSDVASAIYDGVDGVMLSAESASGAYPVQAVSMMERIIKQVEKDVRHTQSIKHCDVPALEIVSDSITMAAREIAHTINIGAIITFTYSGMTAIRASSQRPSSPIVAMSKSIETARFLNLLWGVYPIVFEQTCSFHEAIDIACEKILEHKICQKGELVIITGSTNLYQIHSTDTLQLRKI